MHNPSAARSLTTGNATDKPVLTMADNENKVLEPFRRLVTEAARQQQSQDREMKEASLEKRPLLDRRESSTSGKSGR